MLKHPTEELMDISEGITRDESPTVYSLGKFLFNREALPLFCLCYAYFRWLDDTIDSPNAVNKENQILIAKQKNIFSHSYENGLDFKFKNLNIYEQMLVFLITQDKANGSYLRDCIFDMLLGLEFDAQRRFKTSSHQALEKYSQRLGRSYTNVLQIFTMPTQNTYQTNQGVLAGYASHQVHILRDFYEDISLGYYNVSKRDLTEFGWSPNQLAHVNIRPWVYKNVQKACATFDQGLSELKNCANLRFKLLSYALSSRYIYILGKIIQNDFILLNSYAPSKTEKLFMVYWSLKSTFDKSFDPTLVLNGSPTSMFTKG